MKWLDADISALRVPLFPNAHPVRQAIEIQTRNAPSNTSTSILLPGHPIRKESPQTDRAACGWIFSPFDRFSKLALIDLLGGSLDVHRLKGVFNVGSEWLLFNRVGGEMTINSIPYCRDSRIEVILEQPCFDWSDFERSLLLCLKSPA
ncbi:cobalamin biosynthesis protein CobW [Candidatus Woesearchaeota archaeon]|nr:cobalamin biosynthesis protein CobW [Candidatus Woesearchaeota archaeon]